jgi:hypothetical protein
MLRRGIEVAGLSVLVLSLIVILAMPQAHAGQPKDCTVIGDHLLTCNEPVALGGSPVAITYEPPFSEKSGKCFSDIFEQGSNPDTGILVLTITGSFGGCPHLVDETVTFETRPFFVLPESPIGAVAMATASLGALGLYMYHKTRKSSLET